MIALTTETADSPKGLLSNLLNLKSGIKDDTFSLLLKSFSFGTTDEKDLAKLLDLSKLDKNLLPADLPKALQKLDLLLKSDEKTPTLNSLFKQDDKEFLDTPQKTTQKTSLNTPLLNLLALEEENPSETPLLRAYLLYLILPKE